MCILFIAINKHPNYPTIICANRDEFHQRPTQSMHFWQSTDILAGKDLTAGGTWLGLNNNSQFAALTNYRAGYQPEIDKKSRGDLVIKALSGQVMSTYLANNAQKYHGFNLIHGTLPHLQCFNSISKKSQPLSDGFHSICNGDMDDVWPKMALGQQQLEAAIECKQHLNPEILFKLMQNQQQASDEQLPNTGIDSKKEQLLSSIFIRSPDYGTRTTTLILQDNNGKISVFNRDYLPDGNIEHQNEFVLNTD